LKKNKIIFDFNIGNQYQIKLDPPPADLRGAQGELLSD